MTRDFGATLDRVLLLLLLVALVSLGWVWVAQLGRLSRVVTETVQNLPRPLVLVNGARPEGGRLVLLPERGEVCRGEEVVWRPEVRSAQDTRVVFEAWAVPAVPDQPLQAQTAIPLPLVVAPVEEGRTLRVMRRLRTAELEPGDYYVLASIAPASPSVVLFYRVPFAVRDCGVPGGDGTN